MFSVSHSKLKTWRTCHRKAYYKYILKLMRKRKARPLLRGSIIHDMIEDKVEKRDPWLSFEAWKKKHGKMFKEQIEEYGDVEREVQLLMEGYFRHYKRDPITPIRKDGRRCEYPFEVDLCKGITIKGRMDGAGRTKDKRNLLIERKSHKQIPHNEMKFTDIQSGVYGKIMPMIGFPKPDGVLWDYVRAKCPSTPKLLKSGELSRASIDTMWPVYEQAIKDNGLKVKDYADMEEALEGKEDDFYSRVLLPINQTYLDNLWEETIITAKEMKRRLGKDNTRCVDKHCSWCEFQPVCQAEMLGLDASFILKAEYTKDTYHG